MHFEMDGTEDQHAEPGIFCVPGISGNLGMVLI
jgi:hypothetical protein